MSGQRRSLLPLFFAGLVGVLLIAGTRFLITDTDGASASESVSRDDVAADCPILVAGVSSEKAALVGEMADTFNAAHVSGDDCAFIDVHSVASGLASEALSEGWDEARLGFERPDLWLPTSSSWLSMVSLARQQADLPALLPAQAESVAASPLVLAMPRPMAEALGWPDAEIGWDTVVALANDPQGWGSVGQPQWGAFTLGKTNPGVSTFGFEATVAAFYAATGLSGDLQVSDIAKPDVREFVAGIEQATVHYGPLSSVFLTNLWKADQEGRALRYVSAVPLSEKNVFDYNRGDPDGKPDTGPNGQPSVPLVAVYPADGTTVFDHPFVVLDGASLTRPQQHAADAFFTFLREAPQQETFTEGGFRTYEGEAGAQFTADAGLLPDEPSRTITLPGPDVLAAVLDSWDELRKPGRVLLVIDGSGSMGTVVRGADASRLALAQRAAVAALEELNPRDEVGLWVFSTDLPQTANPNVELVPMAPLSSNRDDLVRAIEGITPGGGTPLYRTVMDAADGMTSALDATKINAIVLLSDGQNEHAFSDLQAVAQRLDVEDQRQIVRVFPIGFSEDADMDSLEAIAQASGGANYDATDPGSIDRVMINVLSSF
jgi:Ca-activated chloride channel family protein